MPTLDTAGHAVVATAGPPLGPPGAQRLCSFHDLRHPSVDRLGRMFDPGCATETAGLMKTASSA